MVIEQLSSRCSLLVSMPHARIWGPSKTFYKGVNYPAETKHRIHCRSSSMRGFGPAAGAALASMASLTPQGPQHARSGDATSSATALSVVPWAVHLILEAVNDLNCGSHDSAALLPWCRWRTAYSSSS